MIGSHKFEIAGILVAILTSFASLYFSIWYKDSSLVGQVQFEGVEQDEAIFSITFVNNGNIDVAVLWSEANISDNIQFDGSRNYEGVIKGLTLKANSITTTKFTVPIAYGLYGPEDKNYSYSYNCLWLMPMQIRII